MGLEPFERVPLGRTGLTVTRLAFGGASIGGLFTEVAEDTALATLEHAWDVGIRAFDTAPLYGYGTSERRLGRLLAGKPRESFTLSTKVGRLVVDAHAVPAGATVDRQAFEGKEDAFYAGTAGRRIAFDYSRDGIRRSLDESRRRLGIDRIDIALIHDPDDHWPEAIGEAYPALHELRDAGVLGAIGAGMNQAPMLARFVRESDIDVILVAGRYTLLDHSALDELLPMCLERDVAVLIGGVMNSGLLAEAGGVGRFDYKPAPPELVERAGRLAAVCHRHDVPLKTAAIRFPLAHPAVTALVTGVRTVAHLDEYPAALRADIPRVLWDDLRTEGLIPTHAPTPD
jgi:D-threo-aldose 1-dehydrogenase